MDKANKFEVAGRGKLHAVAFAPGADIFKLAHDPGVDAVRPVVDGAVWRVPRAAHRHTECGEVGRPGLARLQERHRVDLGAPLSPSDTVVRMDPKLVGQITQSLTSEVTTFGADDCLPLF